jgi:hypothetical protein
LEFGDQPGQDASGNRPARVAILTLLTSQRHDHATSWAMERFTTRQMVCFFKYFK